MMPAIDDVTEKLWAAIQRIYPAISKNEIAAILREAFEAPTADEGPIEPPKVNIRATRDSFRRTQFGAEIEAETDRQLQRLADRTRAVMGDRYDQS